MDSQISQTTEIVREVLRENHPEESLRCDCESASEKATADFSVSGSEERITIHTYFGHSVTQKDSEDIRKRVWFELGRMWLRVVDPDKLIPDDTDTSVRFDIIEKRQSAFDG